MNLEIADESSRTGVPPVIIINLMLIIISIIFAYLIGSMPTGLLFGRLLKGIDIREYGSGNIGATNVFRVVGKIPGIIVLIIDILKGFAPVAAIPHLVNVPISKGLFSVLLGAAAISGHNWTIFSRFKGGKGVATGAGVFLALNPIAVGITLVLFFVLVALTKYISLGSVCSAVILPVLLMLFKSPLEYTLFGLIMGLIVIWRHKENIKRLLQGTENKINFKKR